MIINVGINMIRFGMAEVTIQALSEMGDFFGFNHFCEYLSKSCVFKFCEFGTEGSLPSVPRSAFVADFPASCNPSVAQESSGELFNAQDWMSEMQ